MDANDRRVPEKLPDEVLPAVRVHDSADKERPSVRLKYANKIREFSGCEARLDQLYFSYLCVCEDGDLDRRFRMLRHVFSRVLEGLRGRGVFLRRFFATKSVASLRECALLRSFAFYHNGEAFMKPMRSVNSAHHLPEKIFLILQWCC